MHLKPDSLPEVVETQSLDPAAEVAERTIELPAQKEPPPLRVHPRVRRVVSAMQLTPRQTRIVELVSLGMGPNRIAEHLSIAEATVRTHLRTTFSRLEVGSRVQLLANLLHRVIEESQAEDLESGERNAV